MINRRTKAMLEAVERELGRKLVIVQGSFLAGKAAKRSGPTHNRAGRHRSCRLFVCPCGRW